MTTIKHEVLMTEAAIKALIKETQMKTAEFVAAVIADAEITRAKSVKSPKALIALWDSRELAPGSLRLHVKRVHNLAPKKLPKLQVAKPRATKSANGASRGRKPKAAAIVYQLTDQCDQASWRM